MGNRCVITTEQKRIGVYMHWNGGRDSVEPILCYCKAKGYRCPESDEYGWARLCQVIANLFGGSLSVGIDRYEVLDRNNGDNGVYVIKDWRIVKRIFFKDREEQNDYDFRWVLTEINKSMPAKERLKESELNKAYKDYMDGAKGEVA